MVVVEVAAIEGAVDMAREGLDDDDDDDNKRWGPPPRPPRLLRTGVDVALMIDRDVACVSSASIAFEVVGLKERDLEGKLSHSLSL